MVAAGDPHLVAVHAVAGPKRGIAFEIRARIDVRKRRSRLRFGEAHGAEEAARQLWLHERPDLRFAAVCQQQVGVAHGQQRIGAGPHVGGVQIRQCRLLHHRRQLHATKRVVLRTGHQARLGEGAQRRLHLVDQGDLLAIEIRLALVGLLVVRGEQLLGHALTGVEHRVEGFPAVVGVAFGSRQRRHVQPFVQQELQVAAREQQ